MTTPLRIIRRPKLRSQRKPKRRRGRPTIIVPVALFIAWVIAGIWVLVLPVVDSPQRADVLLVLGPPDAERLQQADELMRQGYIGTLAVSSPVDQAGQFSAPICHVEAMYPVVCFHPEPFTTQGEARALESMAQEYRWRNANVLTARHHVTRARIIIGRCYEDSFHMLKLDSEVPLSAWPYLYIYHTAAFVKAGVNPDC